MNKIFPFLLFLISTIGLSCNNFTPAGFWKNYKREFLLHNISDQGPYGGHSAIYWKAKDANTFNSKAVIKYATNNQWKLKDSLNFDASHIKKWKYGNELIFPLSHTGFSDSVENITTHQYFPRWILEDIKVYIFKTGLITIQPGTDDSIEENGFIMLDIQGKQMAVYHLWGE
ncbi:MAG TPA: hypothetical protein VK498_02320 [Ferruginibacter sp.]|nr:hypothetical protein [Ferruginibacter sp.]